MARINDEISRETAEIIRSELKDPRVVSIVSVLKAEASNDLSHCRVFVSVLGGEQEREDTLRGLASAAGFIRKRLAERVNLRRTPEIKFVFDESMEHGFKIRKLIAEANSAPQNGRAPAEGPQD
jgi:ribosome-binding factor A